METMTTLDMLGVWCGILLTIIVLSFLFDDNPLYKFAEHLFMGLATGYGVVEAWDATLNPNLVQRLFDKDWIYLVPLVLAIMLLMKISKKHGWLARIPIAILVAAYAAVKVTGEASGKLVLQLKDSVPNMADTWEKHGFWDWSQAGAGVFSDAFLVIGLTACLLHFYFSESSTTSADGSPSGPSLPFGSGAAFLVVSVISYVYLPSGLGSGQFVIALMLGLCAATPFIFLGPYKMHLTRFGIMILMLSFGASFGFTVMGRLSLAIGRAQELTGLNRSPEQVEQLQPGLVSLICLGLVITFLVVWRRMYPVNPSETTAQ